MDRHTNTQTETKLKYFDGHSHLSQSEESECMCPSKYFDFVSVYMSTVICRHQHCIENCSQFLQLMKVTVLAESSFIFSPGSLHYADVYRHESGRCHILPFFLTFFMWKWKGHKYKYPKNKWRPFWIYNLSETSLLFIDKSYPLVIPIFMIFLGVLFWKYLFYWSAFLNQ